MHGRSLLSILAVLATSACSLKPGVEDDAAMAAECSTTTIAFGSCATGRADDAHHGYHKALLRRGDQIRVTLTSPNHDLNPGLTLKSPKYGKRVFHEQATPTDCSQDAAGNRRCWTIVKTWTVPSTGVYTFVSFPWSGVGQGNYRMQLECMGGPCAQAATRDAELDGACLGEARDCVLRALGTSPQMNGDAIPTMFQECFRGEQMPTICADTCNRPGMGAMCTETASRLRPFAGKGELCTDAVEDCVTDCVSFNTPASAVTDLAQHPENLCWSAAGRGCGQYGQGLAVCGGATELRTPAACTAACIAREGNTMTSTCAERCEYTLPRAYPVSQTNCPGRTMVQLRQPITVDGRTYNQICPDPDFESQDQASAQ